MECWLCQNIQDPIIRACGCRYSLMWSCASCTEGFMPVLNQTRCSYCKQKFFIADVEHALAKRMVERKTDVGRMETRKRDVGGAQKYMTNETEIREAVQHIIDDHKDWCMVCYDVANDPVRTCDCKGMMGTMCRSCLLRYVNHNRQTHCKKCGARYSIQPDRTAQPGQNRRSVPVLQRNQESRPQVVWRRFDSGDAREMSVSVRIREQEFE